MRSPRHSCVVHTTLHCSISCSGSPRTPTNSVMVSSEVMCLQILLRTQRKIDKLRVIVATSIFRLYSCTRGMILDNSRLRKHMLCLSHTTRCQCRQFVRSATVRVPALARIPRSLSLRSKACCTTIICLSEQKNDTILFTLRKIYKFLTNFGFISTSCSWSFVGQ